MSGKSALEEAFESLLGLVVLGVIGYFVWQYYFKDGQKPTPANNPATAVAHQTNPAVRKQLSVQEEFEGKRAEFSRAYKAAENDIKKSAIYREANAWTKEFCSSHGTRFSNWIGRLHFADTDKGGEKVSIAVRTESQDLTLLYLGGYYPRGSAVYEQAASLKASWIKGDVVYFSFEFEPDSETGFKVSNWTESGTAASPNYSVTLSHIGKSPQSDHGASPPSAESKSKVPPPAMSPDEKKAREAIEEALKL
jgi:hypothetical protein